MWSINLMSYLKLTPHQNTWQNMISSKIATEIIKATCYTSNYWSMVTKLKTFWRANRAQHNYSSMNLLQRVLNHKLWFSVHHHVLFHIFLACNIKHSHIWLTCLHIVVTYWIRYNSFVTQVANVDKFYRANVHMYT